MNTRLPTEERQADIVAATLALARGVSPALITTGDIAAEVGVTQGALFKHFPSKDAIWLATMQWIRDRLLAALNAAAQEADDPLDALQAVFRAHVEFVAAHPGAPRFIFHELQQPGDTPVKQEVRAVLQSYRRLLLRLLEDGETRGRLARGLDREAAATLFVGIVQGLVMQSMAAGKPGAIRAQADRVFALYRRAIGAGR